MDLAKPGLIQKYCRTNALLTFKEYLEDYAGPTMKKAGDALIDKLLAETKPAFMKKFLQERLARTEEGKRDLYI
ncbi:MAG: hypothetical protein PHY31_03325 [Smithellaceae bacterium]|nr:hypothetical protein [Smithellaceae bacterium]